MATATEAYRYARLRVQLFDKDVPTVAVGRTVYFPIRALCNVLGITPQAQISKLRADARYAGAIRDIPIPTVKGLREAACVRKREAARWLSEIDAARVVLSVRGTLQQFQDELFAAADRWLFGDESDVVRDLGSKFDRPVRGTLHLGECPRCGLPLCLVLDGEGQHLRPDGAE